MMSLTRREQFAMAAMQGFVAHKGYDDTPEMAAEWAVAFSDALIAELDRTAPKSELTEDGWTRWRGGDCPVAGDTIVRVRDAGNGNRSGHARSFDWRHCMTIADIVAYQVVPKR